MRLQNKRSYSDAILKTRNLLSLKRRVNQVDDNGSKKCIPSKHSNQCIYCNHRVLIDKKTPKSLPVTFCRTLEICTLHENPLENRADLNPSKGRQKNWSLTRSGFNQLGQPIANQKCKHFLQCNPCIFSKKSKCCNQGIHSNSSFRKIPLLFLCLAMTFLFSSCGIYSGGFQRGGELTSHFLERIEENPQDEEDILLPSKEETER